jgi:hypothetical protein
MEDMMQEYAAKLQSIYDERTAGDHTFSGVLFEFAQQVLLRDGAARIRDAEKEWPPLDLERIKSQLATLPRSTMCRCGDYFAKSEVDLAAHVESMMRVEDGKDHG